jgi:ribonuclease T2
MRRHEQRRAGQTLSLHGLWPEQARMRHPVRQLQRQPFELSKDTIEKIAPWMPNFFYERSFRRL